MEEKYFNLHIVQNNAGIQVDTDGTMNDFEVMGILLHMANQISYKLSSEATLQREVDEKG